MKHRSLRNTLFTLPLLLALGCGGAFGQAMKRGDQFMQSGQWDMAAAEYERAVQLRPGDPKAQDALQRARVAQAKVRVEQARAKLARSDAEGALVLLQEATTFDPHNRDAAGLLEEATTQVLDRAEAMLDNDDLDGAFRLTTLALAGTPDDGRARALDERARDGLAARAYEAAGALERDGKLGAALVELGAATELVSGYRDAEARLQAIKAELKRSVVYHAVIGRFSGDLKSRAIAEELSRTALSDAFGANGLIEVTSRAPVGRDVAGIVIGGQVSRYEYAHRQSTTPRTCTYVCGTRVATNESHTELKAKLDRAERDHAAADRDVARFEAAATTAQRTYDDAAREVDRAQLEVDRARLDLERCEQGHAGDAAACDPERRRLEQELTRLGAAKARAEGPSQRSTEAQANLADAVARRDRAAADVSSFRSALDGTPQTVEVDRRCEHRYVVTNHDVDASVTVTLRAESLGDRAKVLDGVSASFRETDRDAAFPPMPGRCDQLSSGDPLELRSEDDIRKGLAARASAHLVEQIRAQYESYRRSYLDRARRQGRAGLVDEAVDAYLRFLMTAPADATASDASEARSFIQDNKRITAATVDRLL